MRELVGLVKIRVRGWTLYVMPMKVLTRIEVAACVWFRSMHTRSASGDAPTDGDSSSFSGAD